MSAARPQLDSLTGLRGIAAWFVVLYHVRSGAADWLPDAAMAVFAKGYLAVDLFFILSGFVIWLNYAPFFEARGWGGTGRFLQKRLARIWPLHAVVLVAMVGLASILALTGRHAPAQYPWAELPLHFALMQNWGLTNDLSWNHPAWSISTELGAYLMFPLLVLALRLGRWPAWALIAGAGATMALLHLFMTGAGAATLGFDIPGLGLVRCLCQFATGAVICLLWQKSLGAARMVAVASFGISLAAVAAWASGLAGEIVAFPLIAASLLLGLAHSDGVRWNPFRARFMVWLGDISYSTYLIHFFGWIVFKLLFVRDAAHVPLWQTLLFLGLVLAGSIIGYRWIEKPGRDWLGNLSFTKTAQLNAA